MTTENTIATIKRDLIRAFAVLDGWFDKDDTFHQFKPPGNPLPVRNLLAQAKRTSKQVMTLVDNGSLQLSRHCQKELVTEYNLPDLTLEDLTVSEYLNILNTNLDERDDDISLETLRSELRDQLHRCLCHLDLLKNGEGSFYKTRLLENTDHTLDLYQCIYLMSLYMKNYSEQLRAIEEEYRTPAVYRG